MELKDKILKLFKSSKPLKSAQIAEELKIDKKEVDKIIKELKKEDKIYSPERCKYTSK
ncbi:Rrf2 family transcriptional regulator [Candidatus Calescamantes bacterium]|nr:Rrf2 family transcriptional regulator [Candidatus Calescamantes bacterium]MCK5598493.1 Rrf2 family transcriptional regulator [bacterium]